MGKDFDDPIEDFKEYMGDDENFSKEKMDTFEEIRMKRLSGESEGISWDEAKSIITQPKR